jgi:ribonuclease HI
MTTNNTSVRSLVLAIDGACLGNPGPGGWAVIAHEYHHDSVVSRSALAGSADEDMTTNNQMELLAAIKAVSLANELGLPATIFTDSQYVQKGITEWLPKWKTNGWRTADRKPVKNRDLWEQLHALSSAAKISWRWVKAHSGHPMNEAADRLAHEAAVSRIASQDHVRLMHPDLFSE